MFRVYMFRAPEPLNPKLGFTVCVAGLRVQGLGKAGPRVIPGSFSKPVVSPFSFSLKLGAALFLGPKNGTLM